MGDKHKQVTIRKLCSVCLCATRTTHTLGGRLKQYYMHILSGIQMESEVPVVSPRVCWECVSHLKRSVRFREQARRSHNLLHSAIKTCPTKDINGFLLRKLGRPERLKTCISHSVVIAPKWNVVSKCEDASKCQDVPKLEDAPKCGYIISPKCEDDDARMTAACDDDDDDVFRAESLPVKDEEACTEALTVLPRSIEDNTLSAIRAFGETSQVPDKKDSIFSYLKRLDGINVSIKKVVENETVPFALKDCAVVLCSDDKCSECRKELRLDVPKIKPKREPFQCKECNQAFPDKGKLIQHKQTNVACARPFQCEVCAFSFKMLSNLDSHMRTHTGEKPFQCDVCQKAFSQKGTLYKHMTIHTGERPFKCKVCHKAYSQRATLKLHMGIHTGEKPFKCSVCSKTFRQKTNLIEHGMTHTGQKPHACTECPRAYIRRCDLESHMNTHTGAKPFQCEMCPYACATKRSLQAHLREHRKRNTFNTPAHIGGNTFNTPAHLEGNTFNTPAHLGGNTFNTPAHLGGNTLSEHPGQHS